MKIFEASWGAMRDPWAWENVSPDRLFSIIGMSIWRGQVKTFEKKKEVFEMPGIKGKVIYDALQTDLPNMSWRKGMSVAGGQVEGSGVKWRGETGSNLSSKANLV